MTIDKTLLKALRIDLTKALAEVGQRHGLAFDIGTIRFDASTARCTLNMSTTQQIITGLPGEATGDGSCDIGAHSAKQVEAERFLASPVTARLCGAEPEWAGKLFMMKQTQFQVIGLLPSRPKFPILARNVRTGKNFVFPADFVRRLVAA